MIHAQRRCDAHCSIRDRQVLANIAYFAPVASRITTYALPVSAEIAAYVERIHALPALQTWIAEARAENDFLEFDEPYRQQA